MSIVYLRFGNDDLHNYLQLYNLFGLFWGLCFVTALGEMVLAGAFASWYWVLDKSDIPTFPVLNSFGRTLRFYHLNSKLRNLLQNQNVFCSGIIQEPSRLVRS